MYGSACRGANDELPGDGSYLGDVAYVPDVDRVIVVKTGDLVRSLIIGDADTVRVPTAHRMGRHVTKTDTHRHGASEGRGERHTQVRWFRGERRDQM